MVSFVLRDVTGKPCWSTGLFVAGSALRWKASLRCWFCNVTAFTKSWIRLDSLSQLMLRRESSGPASGSSVRELERDEGEKQEREQSTGALFLNCPIWTRPQAAVRIRVSVWGGAPPRMVSVAMLTSSDI